MSGGCRTCGGRPIPPPARSDLAQKSRALPGEAEARERRYRTCPRCHRAMVVSPDGTFSCRRCGVSRA